MPRYKYDIEKKKYLLVNTQQELLCNANKKAEYMIDR